MPWGNTGYLIISPGLSHRILVEKVRGILATRCRCPCDNSTPGTLSQLDGWTIWRLTLWWIREKEVRCNDRAFSRLAHCINFQLSARPTGSQPEVGQHVYLSFFSSLRKQNRRLVLVRAFVICPQRSTASFALGGSSLTDRKLLSTCTYLPMRIFSRPIFPKRQTLHLFWS